MMVFFQNDSCVKCGHTLGFLPDVLDLSALEAVDDNKWQAASPLADGRIYRECANRSQFHVCNWMVPENDPDPFCVACRLNEIIPDLTRQKKPRPLDKTGTRQAPLHLHFPETRPAARRRGRQRGLITFSLP